MPKTCQCQMDNTCRENQNNTVLNSFIRMVIMWFDMVTLMFFFLREDHTHVDQYQRFNVAGPLVARGKHLGTMKDVANVLREKYQPLPGHKLVVQVLFGVRVSKHIVRRRSLLILRGMH